MKNLLQEQCFVQRPRAANFEAKIEQTKKSEERLGIEFHYLLSLKIDHILKV